MKINGKALKKIRENKGYSLRELANITGISASTLEKWESIETANPFPSKLQIVATKLGFEIKDILPTNRSSTSAHNSIISNSSFMSPKTISYVEYANEVERIFRIERRETYFYLLLINFLRSLLSEEELLVPVWDNKGYKDNNNNGIHKRIKYANSHSLQDMIITSSNYSYEKAEKPYVSIEVKKPVLDNNKYEKLQIEDYGQEEQLEFCNYIIFTDCVTWYFIKGQPKKWENSPGICLIEDNKWLPLEFTNEISRTQNINYSEPKEWKDLIKEIKHFIDEAKNPQASCGD